MIKYLKKRLSYLAVIIVLVLGFYLRQNQLYTWPRLGATFDEYAWTWQGMNLVQNGIPMSWSPHPQYTNYKDVIYQKTHFRVVEPFLEHPPVFGIVAGSFAILNGASDMYHLTIQNIRPLAVILGLISILLVYLLTRSLYDFKTAILAALLYATIPTVVVGSRIVQNENFFIPVWLLSLLLIVKYIKNKKSIYIGGAVLLCLLLVLAKMPWVAASGSIFLIFLYLKEYKNALIFAMVPIIGLIIYTIYGAYFDLNLFVNLWGLQLNRYDITFNSIYALFTEPFLVDRFMIDGWIYFGWFSFVLLLVKDIKKNFIVILGLLAYFGIFIFAIPNESGHGWYRYPFYPFLTISIALFIREYFNKNVLLTFFFIIFVGSSLLQLSYGVAIGFSFKMFRGFLICAGIILLPLFFKNRFSGKISSLTANLMLLILFILNIWSVLEYNEQ